MQLPFQEKKVSKQEYIRTFSEETSDHELKWHQDREDRTIVPVSKTDWLFQRDNQLPEPIVGVINIKADEWHRIIKGTGDLVVRVIKH